MKFSGYFSLHQTSYSNPFGRGVIINYKSPNSQNNFKFQNFLAVWGVKGHQKGLNSGSKAPDHDGYNVLSTPMAKMIKSELNPTLKPLLKNKTSGFQLSGYGIPFRYQKIVSSSLHLTQNVFAVQVGNHEADSWGCHCKVSSGIFRTSIISSFFSGMVI